MQEHNIQVVIITPDGDLEASFPQTAKVSELIAYVIQNKGYSQTGRYELFIEGQNEAMQANRTLISYQLGDGSRLIFTEIGVAV